MIVLCALRVARCFPETALTDVKEHFHVRPLFNLPQPRGRTPSVAEVSASGAGEAGDLYALLSSYLLGHVRRGRTQACTFRF